MTFTYPDGTREQAVSVAYADASAKATAASIRFREAQLDYRARRIGDAEFLAAKAIHDKAMAEFDLAIAAERDRVA